MAKEWILVAYLEGGKAFMTNQISLGSIINDIEEQPKRGRKTAKTKTIQVAEVLIPQEFDFIDWADRIKKLAKDPSIELVFKERSQDLWGTDPTIPQTKVHFEEMLHHLSKHDDITCDVETGGLSFVDPRVQICGHVFTAGDKSFYLPVRHNTNEWQIDVDYANKVLKNEVYGRKDAMLNFHNVLYDYNQLLKDGIDLSWRFKEKSIVDTQIMMWLLDENQKDDPYYYILRDGRPAEKTKYRGGFKGHPQKAKELGAVKLEGYSLKVLGPKFIGIPMTKFDDLMELIGFPNLPIHFGGAYAKVDGDATHALKQRYFHKIYDEKLEQAFFNVEMPFAKVNANLQRRGMGINIPALDKLEHRAVTEQNRLFEELYSKTGPIKFSGPQLSALFHDKLGLPILAKTDKGNPQFDEAAMDLYEKFLAEHGEKYGELAEIPKTIIRIKKLEKIIGTYIKGIRKNIDVDGRVHTSLFQTQTVTGRLSSGDPNLQNLVKDPVFVDILDKAEWIKKRKAIGDLNINKEEDFTILFLKAPEKPTDEYGEPLGMEEGWEDKCVKVVRKWLFRDVFSEKVFTPENKAKYIKDYPRFGEIDAYVGEDGHLVTLDLTQADWLYLVGDYSAVEVRMIAHLANAVPLIEAFKQGLDPHKKTASDVFNVDFDHVTGEQRGRAKAVNFGVIYGKTDYGFADDWYSKEPDFLAPSNWHPSGFEPAKKYLKMARGFIDKYFESMPEVKTYIDARQKQVMTNGYVRTITGRKRRLPEVFSQINSVKNRAKRQAVNAIDQGSSADYLKMSMNKMEEWTEQNADKLPLFQLMTVHDEVITLTIRSILDQVRPIFEETMTQTVKLRCPIEMEGNPAYTYGSAK